MRLGQAMFLGLVAALLTLAVPTLARNPNTAKTSEAPSSASCHAYQQEPDGTWTQLPCQEMGSKVHPKSTSKNADQETR